MKPVPCIFFFNHSYFAVVKSFICPLVEPVSYDGFIIISLSLFVNRFQLKNPVFASIRIFLQYESHVFMQFSQSYPVCFFALFILNFLYPIIFHTFRKKREGKQNSQFSPSSFCLFFHFYGTVTIFYCRQIYDTLLSANIITVHSILSNLVVCEQ